MSRKFRARAHFPADVSFRVDILNRRVHVFPLYRILRANLRAIEIYLAIKLEIEILLELMLR